MAESLQWTENQIELLLQCTIEYKQSKESQSIDWESVRTKYEDIRILLNVNLDENLTGGLTKERVSSKLKKIRSGYKTAIDQRKISGGG